MQNGSPKPWKLIESNYVIDDRWLKVRSNTYMTPAGHKVDPYYVIESGDWINCFVVDSGLDIIMVKHYRPAADTTILELVSGGLEAIDSSPEAGMRRELEEEIGYTGGELRQTGVSYANPARQNNKIYSFIAFGGNCDQAPRLEESESLEVVRISFEDFLKTLERTDSELVYQSSLSFDSVCAEVY